MSVSWQPLSVIAVNTKVYTIESPCVSFSGIMILGTESVSFMIVAGLELLDIPHM